MKCEECGGDGWIIFERTNEIQRCDQCNQFHGDLHAAIGYFNSKKCNHYLERIILSHAPPHVKRGEAKDLQCNCINCVD